MENLNYNRFNYRMNPINFYVDPVMIKYQIQRFESEGEEKYKLKSSWDELMEMQIGTYENYDGEKKKRKRKFD